MHAADVPVQSSAVSTTYPANSITLVVVPKGPDTPPTTPPATTPPATTPPVTTPPVTTPPASTPPAAACIASYRIVRSWPGGFQGEVTVRNPGTRSITGWTTRWTFANGQRITQLWNGSFTQSGAAVTVRNLSYNATIPANGSTAYGFIANVSGTNAVPAVTCTSP